jgi:hypothetical protein
LGVAPRAGKIFEGGVVASTGTGHQQATGRTEIAIVLVTKNTQHE